MNGNLTGWNDTIVALATAPGIGAIGIIRLSGEQALSIADELFPSKNLAIQNSHTLHVGFLMEGNNVLDEVVVSIFKTPKSYTGENIVEFSSHGSPFIQQQIIDACIRTGARLAKPGEFTLRAFLNGKLDLTQAEAVADLIASNTDASRKAALHSMRGGFSTDLKELREQLIKFSALIELELDFSQEDVAFADRKELTSLVQQLIFENQKLLQSFKLGNAIKNGVQVAIIGKPNAGKSTLLNTLLNENRAIVSDIAGTTRDTIEEVLNIGGVLFRLIDTAGIREHAQDAIEKIGVEKSFEKMRSAQLVIYLFDVNEMDTTLLQETVANFEKEKIQFVLVGNKVDNKEEKFKQKFAAIPEIIFIAAKENYQVENLKKELLENVFLGNTNSEATLVTNVRHYEALQKLSRSLDEVQAGLRDKVSGDLLALDIRRCLHFLGEITGEITNDDQLDYIFSKFCIGK